MGYGGVGSVAGQSGSMASLVMRGNERRELSMRGGRGWGLDAQAAGTMRGAVRRGIMTVLAVEPQPMRKESRIEGRKRRV